MARQKNDLYSWLSDWISKYFGTDAAFALVCDVDPRRVSEWRCKGANTNKIISALKNLPAHSESLAEFRRRAFPESNTVNSESCLEPLQDADGNPTEALLLLAAKNKADRERRRQEVRECQNMEIREHVRRNTDGFPGFESPDLNRWLQDRNSPEAIANSWEDYRREMRLKNRTEEFIEAEIRRYHEEHGFEMVS